MKDSELNYIEAIVMFCEKNIEIENVGKLINKLPQGETEIRGTTPQLYQERFTRFLVAVKGLEAYRMYLAMRNHFRSKTYNFLKSPYSKAKPETYDKRKDKYFFVKLSRKYDEKQLAQFYLSNFLADNCEWIGAMSANGERNYIEYQKEYNHYRHVSH